MHITDSPPEQPQAPPVYRWQVLSVPLDDPRVTPLLAALASEYSIRYGDRFGGVEQEMLRYPAAEFAAPGGALLIVTEDGVTVAGGAFRQFDHETAELKRIWTSSSHRRRGLARFVLAELEAAALRRGYRRLYLTTGPRQPEARALYLDTGYTALFNVEADPEDVGLLAFEKDLPTAEVHVVGEPESSRRHTPANETREPSHPRSARPAALPAHQPIPGSNRQTGT